VQKATDNVCKGYAAQGAMESGQSLPGEQELGDHSKDTEGFALSPNA